jgi:periplasmic copper chaperone A
MACSRRALWILALCGVLAHAANTPPPISATLAWVRWLPGNLPAGGYLTLRNDGDRPATLVSVSSPDFALLT